jgi:DNA-binding beta-propeller fold protein YncE
MMLVVACSSDAKQSTEYHYDRPTDVAFGCLSFDRFPDGGLDTTTSVAVPPSECATLGQDAGPPVTLMAFAAQETKGDVVVTRMFTGHFDPGDSDPLTPGHNGLSVGTRPVSTDTTPDGCFVVVANAGSCDLSYVDVFKAAGAARGRPELYERGASSRHEVKTGDGATLSASPAWVTTPPPLKQRAPCDQIAGVAYVAYPACDTVAAVDLATGTVKASLKMSAGLDPVIGGDTFTCPQECGAGAVVPPAGIEPAAMVMDPAGGRLYVGARHDSAIFIVDVDPTTGLFSAAKRVPLEDAGGVLRLAVTKDVQMGQDNDQGVGVSGVHRFVYAIAADQSIRVVEVLPTRPPQECDTQVDPRYTRDIVDLSALPCFGVGQPGTPPRRPNARGPGVRLPRGAVPYDVAFMEAHDVLKDMDEETTDLGEPSGLRLNGTYAVVSSRNSGLAGVVYYINVDDENYEDFINPANPGLVDMTLALPHQLRDALGDRRHPRPSNCAEDDLLGNRSNRAKGPVRSLVNTMTIDNKQTYNYNIAFKDEDYSPDLVAAGRIAPMLHQEICIQNEGNTDPDVKHDPRAVFQSSALAPNPVRAKVFPDLASVPTETWQVSWEGPLAANDFLQIHQGGVVSPVPGQLELALDDGSGQFCDVGAEAHDIVHLVGCNVDADCGLGETCYFDAETPANGGGMCLPRDRITELAGACRPLLISQRKYVIKASEDAIKPSRLVLVPKPTVLMTTPLTGCTSDLQCQQLYRDEQHLREQSTGLPQATDKEYTCQNSSELGGVDKCIAVCPGNVDSECPAGSVCQDLRCVEGAFAPQACYGPLQRYEVRAGGAFTVVGSVTGYVHNRLFDASKGVCVDDAAADPLRVGRFHPIEPLCDDADAVIPTGPNPCSVTLEEPMGVLQDNGTIEIGKRKSFGIRFRNYSFRIDFSDTYSIHGPPAADAAHPRPSPDPTVGVLEVALPLGFFFRFEIGAGFIPRADQLSSPAALLPTRARLGPDGAVWVLDSGDANTSLGVRRGEIIRLTPHGVTLVAD